MDRTSVEGAAEAFRGAESLLSSRAPACPRSRHPHLPRRGRTLAELPRRGAGHTEAFARDPLLVWTWYRWRRRICLKASPNPAHAAIAAMESAWPRFLLATQNVDGLHRRAAAGSSSSCTGPSTTPAARRAGRSRSCLRSPETTTLPAALRGLRRAPPPARRVVRRKLRGGRPRGGVRRRASGGRGPCRGDLGAGLAACRHRPRRQENGACLVDVNPDETDLSRAADFHLAAPAGEALPALLALARR